MEQSDTKKALVLKKLRCGDQILSVNNISFLNLRRDEAIKNLESFTMHSIVVKYNPADFNELLLALSLILPSDLDSKKEPDLVVNSNENKFAATNYRLFVFDRSLDTKSPTLSHKRLFNLNFFLIKSQFNLEFVNKKLINLWIVFFWFRKKI